VRCTVSRSTRFEVKRLNIKLVTHEGPQSEMCHMLTSRLALT